MFGVKGGESTKGLEGLDARDVKIVHVRWLVFDRSRSSIYVASRGGGNARLWDLHWNRETEGKNRYVEMFGGR